MNDLEFVDSLVIQNKYLTTEREKAWYRAALYSALLWGHKIDCEQVAYKRTQKKKNIFY